jgi:hypothetical protein
VSGPIEVGPVPVPADSADAAWRRAHVAAEANRGDRFFPYFAALLYAAEAAVIVWAHVEHARIAAAAPPPAPVPVKRPRAVKA